MRVRVILFQVYLMVPQDSWYTYFDLFVRSTLIHLSSSRQTENNTKKLTLELKSAHSHTNTTWCFIMTFAISNWYLKSSSSVSALLLSLLLFLSLSSAPFRRAISSAVLLTKMKKNKNKMNEKSTLLKSPVTWNQSICRSAFFSIFFKLALFSPSNGILEHLFVFKSISAFEWSPWLVLLSSGSRRAPMVMISVLFCGGRDTSN